MKIQNQDIQSWKSVCDANQDGQQNENELELFNEGLKTYWKCPSGSDGDSVKIGNVVLNPHQLGYIRRNSDDSEFDYTVQFKTGVVIDYNSQSPQSVNAIRSTFKKIGNVVTQFFKPKETETSIAGIKDEKGVKVTGTSLTDYVRIEDSTVSSVDAAGGIDSVSMYKVNGTPDKERAPIYAEKL